MLLLAGAGCSRFAGASPPSKGEYIAAADAVCSRYETKIDEIEEEQAAEPDPSRTERWIRADLVPAYRDMAGSLRGIQPPDGDEVYLSGLYADLGHAVDLLHAQPSLGRPRVRDDEDLRRRFTSYGMKVCGRV